jgi:tRNA threonylcarbamoyladenosine biosynthesis protein TsaB
MLLLGLDTATLTLSAALIERVEGSDRVLESVAQPPPTPHSSLLPRLVETMLGRAGARLGDLGAVVVGLGPGSFTGLRISLATAKGLCYAAQLPLIGGSSLQAMALAAAPEVPEGTLLVPCLDARKGEVYCGFYRKREGSVSVEAPEAALGPAALLARLGDAEAEVFGIGREAYPALQVLAPPRVSTRTPDAAALVHLVHDVPPFSKQAVFALEPHYVRPSDSEWTARPKKKYADPGRAP